MQFINETKREEFKLGFVSCENPYSKRIFTYAAEWADLVEQELAHGVPFERCVEACAKAVDTDQITIFMYNMSTMLLRDVWVHGEALRNWHNLHFGGPVEGAKANAEDRLINSAVVVVDG